ncbi:hypothetical protein LCGC14_0418870 [marine sediment metagenome]|uniref:HEAT repeat domain-containing protein n=1 Tax=marine sediment metagenome TaxID=412755 RepID=A0A0F9SXK7_9ZZZZ|nr:hypothetical protein [Phycisphaerae bacterium]
MFGPPRTIPARVLLIALACGLLPGAAGADPAATDAAVGYLRRVVTDPGEYQLALLGLRTLGDKDLTPIFVAMTRSASKETRLFATASLADVAGKDAADALLERLREDPMMAVRSEAIAQLIQLDAIGISDLLEAMQSTEETVQCLAARTLARKQNGRVAMPVLTKLTASSDAMTEAVARASLLRLGDGKQLDALRKIVDASAASTDLLMVLLLQIEEEQIAEAVDLARQLAASHANPKIRLQAYKTIAAISPRAAAELAQVITGDGSVPFRIRVLHLLARRPDGPVELQKLANSVAGPVAALVRLELARLGGGAAAADAALAAVRQAHPIMIDYVLDLARRDIDQRSTRADFYAPALLHVIAVARDDTERMGDDHFRAAQAATLLADLGTDEALRHLHRLLSATRGATIRAVAAGVMKSDNPDVCDAMAPLLDSPYSELIVDAALTLGAHGDARANAALADIIAKPNRYLSPTVAMASWYLVRNSGQAGQIAQALAAGVK